MGEHALEKRNEALENQTIQKILTNVSKVIVGKDREIIDILKGVLSGGHILIEDLPGLGKTTIVKALAKTMDLSFSRIQFTPDLLPSDITGISIYNQKEMNFEFRKGPVFANMVLADEINRTSPRTQAAMLEAMAEQQVTSDGVTYQLPDPFFVLATQNPIEYEGTYPLPEAQLDRFLMQLSLGYPNSEQEVQMLAAPDQLTALNDLEPVISIEEFLKLKALVPSIHVEDALLKYIVDLGNSTRNDPHIRLGISPRGNQFCLLAAKAYALLEGRHYVIPDDIKAVLPAVYRHRLLFFEAYTVEQRDKAIEQVTSRVQPPMRR